MSICIENLCFSYGNRAVLKDISFSVKYGQFLSVLGPNGVGKSTLFRCILGLLPHESGAIHINGKLSSDMSAAELARNIAYIPQSHNPVFNYSVFDMVLMGTTSQVRNFSSPRTTADQGSTIRVGEAGNHAPAESGLWKYQRW